jgi:amino acid transporter
MGLGPLLCWAVVFADIGTSVYYAPGILFHQVGSRAALFVGLTLVVFVLLTLKYSEVAIRYPQGGGVVTVGAEAANNVVGLIGGLFILVDYFLTSALSALSGLIYLSVLAPGLKPAVALLTVAALLLLALLNVIGINADARVTAVIAGIAFASQLALVVAVLVRTGAGAAVTSAHKALGGSPVTGVALLTGYAGAFLAFSGLESIAQLAPAMRHPNRRTAPRAMLVVVITILITSPLLTLWATTLLTANRVDSNQFMSLLGGYAGGPLLEVEIAATAALLLVFASNTAIIGCYHVFLALSRMRFLPKRLQHRNRWRKTPHWAILGATAVPALVVIVANGDTGLLGDMYSFGLLGAFAVTCVGLDVVRWRERGGVGVRERAGRAREGGTSLPMFVLGVLTSVLVVAAWVTNLFAKPLATLFGGIVTIAGLVLAAITYYAQRRRGLPGPVPVVHRLETMLLRHATRRHPVVVLLQGSVRNIEALVHAGLEESRGLPLVFAYLSSDHEPGPKARLLEIVDPFLADERAQAAFAAMQRIVRTERRRHLHAVYAAARQRSAAMAELCERLRPKKIIAMERDAMVRHVFGPCDERSLRWDGVWLRVFSG